MPGKLVTVEQDWVLKDLLVDGRDIPPLVAPNTIASVQVIHQINVGDGATGDIDLVVNDKFAISDVVLIKRIAAGGAGDTIQITDGANNAISEAMSINVANKIVVRNAQIDVNFSIIPANGILRIKRTKASAANVACTLVINGVRA